MSESVLVDVVGPSHWTYMSAVMAESLRRTIRDARFRRGQVPPAVQDEVLEFFRLALEGAGENVPKNPAVSATSYLIAADAVEASIGQMVAAFEVEKQLTEYAQLLTRLFQVSSKLNKKELGTARRMRAFFERLREEGAAQMYQKLVHSESPGVGFRGGSDQPDLRSHSC